MSYNFRPLKRQRNQEFGPNYIVGNNGLCLTLWKHLIFPWLNMEDLAMLLKVCRAFNRNKDLRKILYILKRETFKGGLRSYMFNRKQYSYLANRNRYINTKYYILEKLLGLYVYNFFTSKDMLIRHIQQKVERENYKIEINNNQIKLIRRHSFFNNIVNKLKIKGLTKQDLLKNNLIKK